MANFVVPPDSEISPPYKAEYEFLSEAHDTLYKRFYDEYLAAHKNDKPSPFDSRSLELRANDYANQKMVYESPRMLAAQMYTENEDKHRAAIKAWIVERYGQAGYRSYQEWLIYNRELTQDEITLAQPFIQAASVALQNAGDVLPTDDVWFMAAHDAYCAVDVYHLDHYDTDRHWQDIFQPTFLKYLESKGLGVTLEQLAGGADKVDAYEKQKRAEEKAAQDAKKNPVKHALQNVGNAIEGSVILQSAAFILTGGLSFAIQAMIPGSKANKLIQDIGDNPLEVASRVPGVVVTETGGIGLISDVAKAAGVDTIRDIQTAAEKDPIGSGAVVAGGLGMALGLPAGAKILSYGVNRLGESVQNEVAVKPPPYTNLSGDNANAMNDWIRGESQKSLASKKTSYLYWMAF